jgi:hypothetical protein
VSITIGYALEVRVDGVGDTVGMRSYCEICWRTACNEYGKVC